ncbi:MAG: phage tail terminator-like protein, partial [Endozoicomonas sp.]
AQTVKAASVGPQGVDRHEGGLLISLNYPLNVGDDEMFTKVDEIRSRFRVGAHFSHQGQMVRIASCECSQGEKKDGFYRIALTINWYAQSAR